MVNKGNHVFYGFNLIQVTEILNLIIVVISWASARFLDHQIRSDPAAPAAGIPTFLHIEPSTILRRSVATQRNWIQISHRNRVCKHHCTKIIKSSDFLIRKSVCWSSEIIISKISDLRIARWWSPALRIPGSPRCRPWTQVGIDNLELLSRFHSLTQL